MFPSNRGRQRPEGPTPGFWEVDPGRGPRMWVQRSVTQYQQQQCTTDTPPLSLESLRPVQKLSELTHPFPPHQSSMCTTNTSFLPESPLRAGLLQGRKSWLNLCLPLPSYFLPKNPGLPSKTFLGLTLNLILLTNKTESDRQNGLPQIKQLLEGWHTPRSYFSFSGLPNDILLPSPHLPPNSCQHRWRETAQKYIDITGYLHWSMLTHFTIPLQNKKAKILLPTLRHDPPI